MKQDSKPISAQCGTLRICDVPDGVPIGEALREADRIAFGHLDVKQPIRPGSLPWDFVKSASTAGH